VSTRATIVLIGAPGAGKSSVGRLLGFRLGMRFADVDELIEDATGATVREIFADAGEAEFRRLEVEHTLGQLSAAGVVALGGGAVMSEQIRDALTEASAEVRVVWLKVSGARSVQRVGLNTARPLLLGNVRGNLIRLLAERGPVYASVAHLTVDTDDQQPDDVVETIVTWLADQPDHPAEPGGVPR